MLRLGLVLLTAIARVGHAASDQPNDALGRAERLSSLTGPGSQPFHLKLVVSEPANPQSPYSATIEEFWQSASDWYRTIQSPHFQQHVVVTAGKRTEENVGGYYPIWLRNFVTAATDPIEDAPFWQRVSARIVQTTSTNGHPSSSCARAQFKVGSTTLSNDAFAVICFNADGTLSSIVRPGYDMEFHDPHVFGKKHIASSYIGDPAPGTELVGRVEVLDNLGPGALPTPPPFAEQTSGPIKSVRINQESFERLSATPVTLVWPPVHSGNTSGKLSMYVSSDRDGHVREAYPLNSDNAGLQDAARDQLLKWQLRPAVSDGEHVQTEAALTFSFSTALANASGAAGTSAPQPLSSTYKPIVISPVVSSSLQIKSYAPVYPQALKERHMGGKVALTAIIGKKGEIISLAPLSSTDPEFTKAAIAAVQQWVYKPYLLNGSPVEIETVITVNFQAR